MSCDSDVIRRWAEAAPFWEKYREVIRDMFAPVSTALIDAAEVQPGQNILDVATGPGEPALTIASLVGPGGRVCGVDPVTGMIDAARREAERLGLANTRFDVASADHLPHADESFDAAVSRFGVMFFPAPLDGVRELLRVLKPGARIALAAWRAQDCNPFFTTLSTVLKRYLPSPPPEPDAPDAFRFAEPGKLARLFAEARIANLSERDLRFDISVPLTPEEFWTFRTEMSDSLREKLPKLSPGDLELVRKEAIDAVRPYVTPAGLSFPAEVFIVSGNKPQ